MPNYEDVSEEIVASAAEISSVNPIHKQLNDYFNCGSTRSLKARMESVKALQRLINENKEAIAAALKADLNQADPTPHLVEMERETNFMITHLSDLIKPDAKTWDMSLVNFPCAAEVLPEPLGVVLIIGTWNYPFHSALGPLAGALAAGNTVLVKPGSLARNSSRLMAELINIYFNPNLVRCLEGGREIIQPLLEMRWDHIMFTGSPVMGKIVMQAAAKHLTSVTLELGGKNPVVVEESADISLAARRVCWSKFASNAGQVCISCDHLFVHENVSEKFIDELRANIRTFFPEGPDKDENYCRIVSRGHTERLKKILTVDAKNISFGGEVDVESKFVGPTVIDFKHDWEAFGKSACMSGEIFGPILTVVRYTEIGQVENFLRRQTRDHPPLAFYIFSGESRRSIKNRWVNTCPAGAMVTNDCGMHIVEDELPFGGLRTSGMGAYHGKKSFEIFTHYKPVLWKTGWLDIPMRYPPFTLGKQRIVRFLLWMGRKGITPFRIGKFALVVALLWRIMV
jgi:acyl-CoA reductase-like NAD-dependent aldehyde dehydrogenase